MVKCLLHENFQNLEVQSLPVINFVPYLGLISDFEAINKQLNDNLRANSPKYPTFVN